MRPVFIALFLSSFANATFAQSMDSMILANSLGSVLASEEMCNLHYDQGAISAWISSNVAADDMGFASNLNMQITGQTYMYADMSDSAKTAHCAAISQTATHYGFLK